MTYTMQKGGWIQWSGVFCKKLIILFLRLVLYTGPLYPYPLYIYLLIYNFYIKKYGPLDPLRKNPYISSLRSINLDPIPIGSTLDPLDHFAILT